MTIKALRPQQEYIATYISLPVLPPRLVPKMLKLSKFVCETAILGARVKKCFADFRHGGLFKRT